MKKAVMYGAGNIGRGFIGQLFSESGYEVAFVDVNMEVIGRLNADRAYPVVICGGGGLREVSVGNVRGVDGSDPDAVAAEIADASVMATAVGVNVLPRIASTLAKGLSLRWSSGNPEPLNIIVCENMVGANRHLKGLIEACLADAGDKARLSSDVGFVEASIGRMVPVMTPEMQAGNALRVYVEEYCSLPVDGDAIVGPVPPIKNLLPYAPFDFHIKRKLYVHNMGHALTAYLGHLVGHELIWEAIEDPNVQLSVLKSMLCVGYALSKEYGADFAELYLHAEDLIARFGNKALNDTVRRVGNDTLRKLSPDDRLIGALGLCRKHGLRNDHLAMGIAAAMLFDAGDPKPGDVREILAAGGPGAVLDGVCRLEAGEDRDAILR
ncbi:MAG: hypothetical protein FWE70_03760, partial [Oscillospiraceae bacterium]|nr:hypothetical protein [Oscillospiraceae bacterium]